MLKDILKQSRSYRRFYQEIPIQREKLLDWVDNTRYCPSGMNAQVFKYKIVTEPEECEKIFASVRWAAALKDWDGPAEGERPVAYIVLIDDLRIGENRRWDAGIVSQTIMLSAVENGYGGCILGSFNREQLARKLDMDSECYVIELVLAFGKPKEDIKIVPIAEDGNTVYYRDEEQVHYVPKRDLNDIILG